MSAPTLNENAMDDLTATRLCAEAMGYTVHRYHPEQLPLRVRMALGGLIFDPASYNPLHDDAQAMALVKRFPSECTDAINKAWLHSRPGEFNINRAVAYCVARMQEVKS